MTSESEKYLMGSSSCRNNYKGITEIANIHCNDFIASNLEVLSNYELYT